MKREELRKLGLTDEQVDTIMGINGEDVNAQKAIITQRDQTIASLTSERDSYKQQVTDRDKDIEALKKSSGDNESLNKKLTELQQKYDADTKTLNETITKQARDRATDEVFAGLKFTSAYAMRSARAEFDKANLELKDGKYIGADDIIKKMRADNADAFKVDEPPKDDKPPVGDLPKFTKPLSDGGKVANNNPFNLDFTPIRNTGLTTKKE